MKQPCIFRATCTRVIDSHIDTPELRSKDLLEKDFAVPFMAERSLVD